jgi:AGCS family alanine or glycine:cation symporter
MGTAQAQTVMAIAGVSLLIINGIGIFLLRNEISFNLTAELETKKTESVLSDVSLEQV